MEKTMNKEVDIPELTEAQIQYIKTQQARADALVSDPDSPNYEPDVTKRRTASRKLMREWEHDRSDTPSSAKEVNK